MNPRESSIKQAIFFSSYGLKSKYPDEKKNPHFAFCGRSNAGKSSLIHTLIDKKANVKISSTPGKTKTLNFFLVNENFFLVDLPGFGYAKASNKERDDMIKLINHYLNNTKNLVCLFVLCDSRRKLPAEEQEIISICYEKQILPVLIRTKFDKLNSKERNQLKKENANVRALFPELKIIASSTKNGSGKKEILDYIM